MKSKIDSRHYHKNGHELYRGKVEVLEAQVMSGKTANRNSREGMANSIKEAHASEEITDTQMKLDQHRSAIGTLLIRLF